MTEATARPDSRRNRRWIVAALLAVTLVCGFVGIFAVWVNRQALNPKAGTQVSSNLLQDPKIQKAVSVYLVDQLFTSVDVQAQIAQRLPVPFQRLAGPASGALRQFADREAPVLIASPKVQELWRQANLVARRQLLSVVKGGGDALSTTNGDVVLDLQPLIRELAARLGLSSQLAAAQGKVAIPPDTGKLVIMKSDQLDTAQTVANALRPLAVILTILTFGLLIVAVALASGWRRVALRRAGFVLVALGLLVLLIRRVVGNRIVDALVPDTSVRGAAHNAWDISTQMLKDISTAVFAYGVVVVIAAWLAGPTRLATRIRGTLAPVAVHSPGYMYGAATFLFLLVLLWGPTPALRQPAGIVFVGILLALGTELWRRQIAEEFPGGQPDDTPDPIPASPDAVREPGGKAS